MLDLKRLIRDNRNFKILLNNSLMSKDIRDKIRHVEKNLIDLDSELSESEDYNNEQIEFQDSKLNQSNV